MLHVGDEVCMEQAIVGPPWYLMLCRTSIFVSNDHDITPLEYYHTEVRLFLRSYQFGKVRYG